MVRLNVTARRLAATLALLLPMAHAQSWSCPNTLTSGANTEYVGWRVDNLGGQRGCTALCIEYGRGATCDGADDRSLARQRLVANPATLEVAIKSITSSQGPANSWLCTSFTNGDSHKTKPSKKGSTCSYGSGGNSNCGSGYVHGPDRLCCCLRDGEDAATMCPVSSTDCGVGTVWDAVNSFCRPSAGCLQDWYLDVGANTCMSCGVGGTTDGPNKVSANDCTCAANYWNNGVKCVSCGAGTSPPGSTLFSQCTCNVGFWKTGEVCTNAYQRWRTGGDLENCLTVCSNAGTLAGTGLTCNADRNSALFGGDAATVALVMANIASEQGSEAAWPACTSVQTAASSGAAPGLYGTICRMPESGSSSNCGSATTTFEPKRLCCCLAEGEDPATFCPVSATECVAGSWWDAATSLCESNAGCRGGWWKDVLTDPANPTCRACPIAKFGPNGMGMTSEAEACTGSAATCAAGTFGASLTKAGMTACADCPTSFATTLSGEMYCTALTRWYVASVADQSCDAACTAAVGAGTCAAGLARVNLVTDAAKVGLVLAAVAADKGGVSETPLPCASDATSTDIHAPFRSVAGNCYWQSGGFATCDSKSPAGSRICCCIPPGVGEVAEAVCPLTLTDCGGGQSYDALTGRCVSECAVGYYGAPGSCVLCPQGKFGTSVLTTTETTRCLECDAGKYAGTAVLSYSEPVGCPNECGAGKYAPLRGQTSIAACSELCSGGKWSDQTGLSSDVQCTDCAVGLLGPLTGQISQCAACSGRCSAGKHANGVSALSSDSQCVNCAAGLFTGAATGLGNALQCVGTCSTGKYSIAVGQADDSSCAPCADGKYSFSPSECRACTGTHRIPSADQGSCIDQPPKECLAGEYSPDIVATCAKCPAGRRGQATAGVSSTCTDCGLGYFGATEGRTECAACAANHVTGIDYNSTFCRECDVGKLRDVARIFCTSCLPGEFRDNLGASEYSCKPCTQGRASAGLVDGSCAACEAGQFTEGAGKTACRDCDPGEFLPFDLVTTATECKACPVGKVATMTKATECKSCSVGSIPDAAQSVCEPCRVGTYAAASATVCSSCGSEGMDCSGGVIKLSKGWWYDRSGSSKRRRLSSSSSKTVALTGTTVVYQCLNPDACAVANNTISCALNTGGPLCAVCDEGYVPDAQFVDGRCKECTSSDEERWGSKMLMLALSGVFVFIIALVLFTRPAPKLKIERFLVVLNVRRILRRSRKRVLRKLHERDLAAGGVAARASSQHSEAFEAHLKSGDIEALTRLRSAALATVAAASAFGATQSTVTVLHGRLSIDRRVNTIEHQVAQAGRDALADVVGADDAVGVDTAQSAGAQAAGVSQLKSFAAQISAMFSSGQLKIAMGNLQINASLTVVFSIPWPPLHTRFLGLLNLFKFDVFKGLAFAAPCLHASHYMSLTMFIGAPIVIIMVFVFAFVCVTIPLQIVRASSRRCRRSVRALPCGQYTVASAGAAALKFGIVVVLFIYPTICSKVFMTFKCVDLGNGQHFMEANMSIACFEGDWLLWAGIAGVAMLVYVIGIPLACLVLLWGGRRRETLWYPKLEINDPYSVTPELIATQVKRTNEYFVNRIAYGSLYMDYDVEYWWFEFGCTVRKMILTGALVLFGAGSTPQVLTALAVCILWFALIANCKPFAANSDDRLAQVEGLQVLFTLLLGLVIQIEANASKDTTKTGAWGDQDSLAMILIAMNCIVVLLAVVQQPIVLKIFSKLIAIFSCIGKRVRAKREWETAWVVEAKARGALPSEMELEGSEEKVVWCDRAVDPPRILHFPPLRLVATVGTKRWFFDSQGNVLGNPRRVTDAEDETKTYWVDMETKRLLDVPPTQLYEDTATRKDEDEEGSTFNLRVHWLDVEMKKLLRAAPGRLVFNNNDSEGGGGSAQMVWRHRVRGEVVTEDPGAAEVVTPSGGDAAESRWDFEAYARANPLKATPEEAAAGIVGGTSSGGTLVAAGREEKRTARVPEDGVAIEMEVNPLVKGLTAARRVRKERAQNDVLVVAERRAAARERRAAQRKERKARPKSRRV